MGRRSRGLAAAAVLAVLVTACGRERWEPGPASPTPVVAVLPSPEPTPSPSATAIATATPSTAPSPATTPPLAPTPLFRGDCVVRVKTFPTRTTDEPTSLAQGPDGAAWFAAGREIGRMTSAGEVKRFALPADVRAFSIANGFGHELWFTDQGTTAIGRISTSGSVRMFPTPTREGNPIGVGGPANPYAITKGPDGAMWFTESAADRIGRIDPQGRITEYKLPSYDRVHANPQGIVRGPDDRLWFVQPLDGTVAAFDPKTKRFAEYDLPVKDAFPSDITSENRVLFVADPNNGIARVKTDGTVTFAPPPSAEQEIRLVGTPGHGSAAWYIDTARGGIGRIEPTGTPREQAKLGKGVFGTEGHPAISAGPDGGTWFVASQARKLGSVLIACP